MMKRTPTVRRILTAAGCCALLGAAMTPVHAATEGERSAHHKRLFERSEHGLENLIAGRLAGSGALAGSKVDVEFDGSEVILTGFVSSQNNRMRAERIARSVPGVRTVSNKLAVDAEAVAKRRDTRVSDEVLVERVAKELASKTFPWASAREDWLFGWEIDGLNWEFDVEVDDGRVTLDGTVDDVSMLYDAVAATRSIPGVRSVDAELTIGNDVLLNYPTLY